MKVLAISIRPLFQCMRFFVDINFAICPKSNSLGKKLIANQGIVATNGRIHQAILEAIKNSNA